MIEEEHEPAGQPPALIDAAAAAAAVVVEDGRDPQESRHGPHPMEIPISGLPSSEWIQLFSRERLKNTDQQTLKYIAKATIRIYSKATTSLRPQKDGQLTHWKKLPETFEEAFEARDLPLEEDPLRTQISSPTREPLGEDEKKNLVKGLQEMSRVLHEYQNAKPRPSKKGPEPLLRAAVERLYGFLVDVGGRFEEGANDWIRQVQLYQVQKKVQESAEISKRLGFPITDDENTHIISEKWKLWKTCCYLRGFAPLATAAVVAHYQMRQLQKEKKHLDFTREEFMEADKYPFRREGANRGMLSPACLSSGETLDLSPASPLSGSPQPEKSLLEWMAQGADHLGSIARKNWAERKRRTRVGRKKEAENRGGTGLGGDEEMRDPAEMPSSSSSSSSSSAAAPAPRRFAPSEESDSDADGNILFDWFRADDLSSMNDIDEGEEDPARDGKADGRPQVQWSKVFDENRGLLDGLKRAWERVQNVGERRLRKKEDEIKTAGESLLSSPDRTPRAAAAAAAATASWTGEEGGGGRELPVLSASLPAASAAAAHRSKRGRAEVDTGPNSAASAPLSAQGGSVFPLGTLNVQLSFQSLETPGGRRNPPSDQTQTAPLRIPLALRIDAQGRQSPFIDWRGESDRVKEVAKEGRGIAAAARQKENGGKKKKIKTESPRRSDRLAEVERKRKGTSEGNEADQVMHPSISERGSDSPVAEGRGASSSSSSSSSSAAAGGGRVVSGRGGRGQRGRGRGRGAVQTRRGGSRAAGGGQEQSMEVEESRENSDENGESDEEGREQVPWLERGGNPGVRGPTQPKSVVTRSERQRGK
uniref:Uncharacterized protein n=1 Tax=Chromera velia CCMP2878 TaxID=1169474 RepID=A0A0G4I2I2_9ALVE|eukprot:Cvel_10415.t1-p1 / transcript=Cvel_10415.t1 / gene=Cvel_10415 / organism=Chromera_velia_CCMP2878 / gene_product=hypothetical protein / transcript_product=hypothetical protein / location=Cvel_scaffold628:710-5628(-) / protein_length=818 / sequence_SO=supercontig / SO=protein_coding / is_pseudo=false